ncbi:MAG: signal peptide peptidase SppA [Flavobacteriales bacterium]|nr:signal peptide peptidase SppA [Flavobacteriales bacterium]
MKGFFKYVFASCLGSGLFLVAIALVFLIIGMIGNIFGGGDDDKGISDGSVLLLEFDRSITDRDSKNDFNFSGSGFGSEKSDGLNNILEQIERAKNDDNIEGIYMEIVSMPGGGTTAEEIRDKLVEFKETGKWIYTYSESMSQGAYHMATVSDSIFLYPEGAMEFKGLFSELLFMKGFFEKAGVEFQVIRPKNNTYKSAVEPFTLDKMSDANREQMKLLVDGIWGDMLKNISKGRNISIEELNRIADGMLATSPDDALKYKLVDGLWYEDQVIDMIKEKLGLDADDKIPFVNLSKYTKRSKGEKGWSKREKIAVVYAVGAIESGEGDDATIGSERIARGIRRARKDSSIQAIVLRVNSPGGSALASDVILREMSLTKGVKPLVVSMGNLAASGGYYISCNADRIFASENTITGSIGAFGLVPNVQEMLNDKLGLTTDTVKTNKMADFYTGTRPFKPEEEALLQDMIDDVYGTFAGLVADGRGLDSLTVANEIGQGRVWTGTQALGLGLVDEIGGLEKAMNYAAEQAGLEEYRVKEYPKQEDPFQKFLEEFGATATIESVLKNELGEEQFELYQKIKEVKKISKIRGVQMRMPFEINIK